jgi:hypothetical protein
MLEDNTHTPMKADAHTRTHAARTIRLPKPKPAEYGLVASRHLGLDCLPLMLPSINTLHSPPSAAPPPRPPAAPPALCLPLNARRLLRLRDEPN